MRILHTSSKTRTIATNSKVALMFVALLVIFAMPSWALVPIRDGVAIDLVLILAALAALIGGPVITGLSGLVWALTRFGGMHPISVFFMHLMPLVFAQSLYVQWRISFPTSKRAPYVAVAVASVLHAGLWWLFSVLEGALPMGSWGLFLIKCLGEGAFAIIVLWLVLDELRKHHILNGNRQKR